MDNVKGLFFDVGGTIFDWKNTVRKEIATLAEISQHLLDSEAFAVDWRATMFGIHSEVRNGNLPWMNSDEMHLLALENMTERYPLLSRIDKHGLVQSTWHNLRVFQGAVAAIERLRSRYTVLVLTILNMQSIVNSSKKGGVIWDGILSCELLGFYKPSLQSYRKAIRLMGFKPDETCMVAAHKGDLAAAASVGMHTVYIQVPEKDHVEAGFTEPKQTSFDFEADSFDSLCGFFGV